MEFLKIAELFSELEKTPKRLKKIRILKSFARLNREKSVLLFDIICGNFYRELNRKTLGISLKTLFSVLGFVSKTSQSELENLFNKCGDIGDVALSCFASKKQAHLGIKKIDMENIVNVLLKISQTSGKHSNLQKQERLTKLFFGAQTELEYKFLARLLVDDLRIGCSVGVVKEAHFQSLCPEFFEITTEKEETSNMKIVDLEKMSLKKTLEFFWENRIKRNLCVKLEDTRKLYNSLYGAYELNYNLLNSFKLFDKFLENTKFVGILNPKIKLKIPIRSILGVRAATLSEIFEIIPLPFLADFKYDGLRIQIHKSKKEPLTIFTRNLENITEQFPEIVAFFENNFLDISAVFDCECVAISSKNNSYLPFQVLSKRILTKNVEDVSYILIQIKVFDLLYLNGDTLIKLPYKKRREMLEKLFLNRDIVQKKK